MDKKIEDFFEIIKETVIDAEENGKPSGFKDGELCAYHCYEESMTDQRVPQASANQGLRRVH